MAINLWQTGGQPTSFNPLPASASISSLPLGEYEISFRAKSDSNSVLRITDNGNFSYVIERTLTPTMTEYNISLNQKKENRFYLFDMSNRQDIIIENINLVVKPMGKATINGLDGFGTVKEGFTGKLGLLTDFKGKIQGSTVENPHSAFTILTKTWSPPTSTSGRWDWDNSQTSYDQISTLNGVVKTMNVATSGNRAGILMSFNVIAEVEKHICKEIPANDLAGKVRWVRENVSSISNKWYGYGSSPLGNKAWIAVWHVNSNGWTLGWNNHTASTIQGMSTNVNANLQDRIDANGMIHFMAYADVSDGLVNSTIHTDYVSLEIIMKQATVVDSKWTFHQNVTVIDDETIELNATSKHQQSKIWIPVKGGETYNYSIAEDVGTVARFAGGWEDASGVNISYTPEIRAGVTSQVLVPPVGAKFLRLSIDTISDTVLGKFVFKRPMLNLGSIPMPYEPKRGERMVMPIAKRNLITSLKAIVTGANGNNTSEHIVNNYEIKTKPTVSWAGFYGKIDGNLQPLKWLQGRTLTLSFIVGEQTNSNGEGQVALTTKTTGSEIYVGTPIYITNAMIGKRQSMTVTVPANAQYLNLGIRATGGLPPYVHVKDVQLEEGSIATTHEPYEVQINAKPSKLQKTVYKPADFKLNSFTSLGDYSFKVTGSYWYSEGARIPVLPNTEYTYSFRQEVVTGGACYTNVLYYPDNTGGVNTLIGESGYSGNIVSGVSGKTFITPPNCYYIAMRVGRANSARSYEVNYYDFRFGLKSEMTNKIAFGKSKNVVQKSDFKELQSGSDGLAKPLTQYGSGGYSISDDVYIPNTKSQRITWTSTANNGVAMLNRGLRLTLADSEFDLSIGETYVISFYGKGWENKASGIGWYAVNTGKNLSLSTESLGNGWYRYSYRFQYTRKDGAYIYVRPNNNMDYSYDCLMNGLQIEASNNDKPTTYGSYKPKPKPSLKGLVLDGKDDFLWYRGFAEFANKNFTIESTFTWNGTNAVDNAQQTIFSCGDIRFGINNQATGYLGVYTPTSNWITTKVALNIGSKYKMKAVYTPTTFSIYIDDVLAEIKSYSGEIKPYSQAFIGNLGGGSYFFNGVIHTMKVTIDNNKVIDLDFNTPSKIAGNTIIDNIGAVATIAGNPRELIKRAKR